MRTILHVTPHLGGGVGRVLLNYLAHVLPREEDRHAVCCLDHANFEASERAARIGVPLEDRMASRMSELLRKMSDADLVLVHWWNNPLLLSLLVCEPLPPVRLLFWSHVSGHAPPQNFTGELLAYPDFFVVATPSSLETPLIRRLPPNVRRDKVRLVFSCAGFEHVASVVPRPHEGFRVGYIGTVDYCKMHRDFIRMSAAADIPDVRFVVCGGPKEAELREEAERCGVGSKFDFPGYVDAAKVLAAFDVFGYPLAPGHYGTGEQALIEALAAGAPPVVMDNGSERHVVEDGATGIVVKDETDYTRALEFLYKNPGLRKNLSENARKSARLRFTIEKTAQSWRELYEEAMQAPKRPRRRPLSFLSGKATGAEIFLASLGEYGVDFAESLHGRDRETVAAANDRIARMSGLWRAETRGSVFHYLSFFPDDPHLNFWCELMRRADGDVEGARRCLARAGMENKNKFNHQQV